MVQLFCSFCGHKWDHSLRGRVVCPSCEYADTQAMFQVLDYNDADALSIWKRLESCLAPHRGSTTCLRTAFIPKDNPAESQVWQRLLLESLLFDQLLVFEQWKHLYHDGNACRWFRPIFEKLVGTGIAVPVEDPETMFPVSTSLTEPISIDPSVRSIIEAPTYVNLVDCLLAAGTDEAPEAGFYQIDWLAHMQTSYLLKGNPSRSKVLFEAHRRAYPNNLGPDLYDSIVQGMRFQSLAVLFDCQLSLHHEWLEPLLLEMPRVSAASDEVVNQILFDGRFMFAPKARDVDRFLDLRMSPPAEALRRDFHKVRMMAAKEVAMYAGDIRHSIEAQLDEVNKRIGAIGEYVELGTTGLLATAGSLFNGLPGAVLGGIGGSVIGKAASIATEAVLRCTNRNWAMMLGRYQRPS